LKNESRAASDPFAKKEKKTSIFEKQKEWHSGIPLIKIAPEVTPDLNSNTVTSGNYMKL